MSGSRRIIITGHGRSGTHWLARELNRSREWDFAHERPLPLAEMQGTVNSYLRVGSFDDLHRQAYKIAVILRNPVDIAKSVKGRTPGRFEVFLGSLYRDLESVARLAREEDVHCFRFVEMTTSRYWLKHKAAQLGVTDIDSHDFDMTPVSSSSVSLTEEEEARVRSESDWFSEEFDL